MKTYDDYENSCVVKALITNILFLSVPMEWHMVFVSSAEPGEMEAADWGYSIYGSYSGLNSAFTGVSMKEWIATSDTTGKAHPN